jgi:hypothetical protein
MYMQVCGIASGEHQSLGYACFITLATTISRRPVMDNCELVWCPQDGPRSKEFEAVLGSIPLAYITDLADSMLHEASCERVLLSYAPGKAKVVVTRKDVEDDIVEEGVWGSE